MNLMETGYAVVTDGKIDVRTVSPTERAAKVNWLWLRGFFIIDDDPDDAINDSFATHSAKAGAELTQVYISTTPPPLPIDPTVERSFPDGTVDRSTYTDVDEVLRKLEAPLMSEDGKRWLTHPERIEALVRETAEEQFALGMDGL